MLLHLALGTAVIIGQPQTTKRDATIITVTLDSFDLPPAQQAGPHKAQKMPVMEPAANKPAPPARQSTPEIRQARDHQTEQPERSPAAVVQHIAEQGLSSEQPRNLQEKTSRPTVQALPAAPALPPGNNPVISEARPATEQLEQRYLQEHFAYIRDLIAKQLLYPPMARKMGWSGRTTVTFMILEDGSVQNIRITASSGFPVLDRGAVETVRKTAPFPRPPLRATITVPISFKTGR